MTLVDLFFILISKVNESQMIVKNKMQRKDTKKNKEGEVMRISDEVANYIRAVIEDSAAGYAEIQRNELAQLLGCVPSQINYVITSRFTPEQGYIVESRRGSGGYIKITRVQMDRNAALTHVINSVGQEIDFRTADAMLINLVHNGYIEQSAAQLILTALSERSLLDVSKEARDKVRSTIFKNMLLTQI